MKFRLQPWHLLLLILAGWTNRKKQEDIEYLLTENWSWLEAIADDYLGSGWQV